jgi:hypothetical protein
MGKWEGKERRGLRSGKDTAPDAVGREGGDDLLSHIEKDSAFEGDRRSEG